MIEDPKEGDIFQRKNMFYEDYAFAIGVFQGLSIKQRSAKSRR